MLFTIHTYKSHELYSKNDIYMTPEFEFYKNTDDANFGGSWVRCLSSYGFKNSCRFIVTKDSPEEYNASSSS